MVYPECPLIIIIIIIILSIALNQSVLPNRTLHVGQCLHWYLACKLNVDKKGSTLCWDLEIVEHWNIKYKSFVEIRLLSCSCVYRIPFIRTVTGPSKRLCLVSQLFPFIGLISACPRRLDPHQWNTNDLSWILFNDNQFVYSTKTISTI